MSRGVGRAPDELDEYDFESELRTLAESRYVLVCRKGCVSSWPERVLAFLTRRPVEPATLVAETPASTG